MTTEHSPFQSESKTDHADKDTAKRLVEEFKINVKSQGYHYKGDFFGQLDRYEYPVALLDLYGYIIIESEHEIKCKTDVTETIHVPGGISRMPQHIKYPHEPKGIKNYQEQLTNLEMIRTKKNVKKKNKKSIQKTFSIILLGEPGICQFCKNDFSDLESHYLRNPTHRR